MPVKGLGDCGICNMSIQDPKTGVPGPVRHFKGHVMAHKACFEKWSANDQRLMRAREAVSRLSGQIAAMQGDLAANQAIVDELSPKSQDVEPSVS
jgi:hypothetical protein